MISRKRSRPRKKPVIEERLTFTRRHVGASWKAALDGWFHLCSDGPDEWFELPERIAEIDLVITTDGRDAYPLKPYKPDSALWCAYFGKEYVTFASAVNGWLSRMKRQNPGRKFYAAIEVRSDYPVLP